MTFTVISVLLAFLTLALPAPTPVKPQDRNARFDECWAGFRPCKSQVTVKGSPDSCIAVHSPGLKSAHVTAVFLTRSFFGISAYRQMSHFEGFVRDAPVISADKPLCLCRPQDGFHDELACDAKALAPGKYGIALRIKPIEDLAGNRDFDETLGIADFTISTDGSIRMLP